jgi:beta-galactosidase
MIQAFRAPVDNDRSFGNWLAKDWIDNNLNSPVVSTDSILHSIRKDGALIVVVSKTNRYKSGKIKAKLIYTVTSDGTVEMECHFIPVGDLPELPRLGIALAITPEYTDFSWYGRGPQENYPDRKDAALVGNWKGKVSEQTERYPRPQETGNKEEIRTLSLTNNRGRGLKVEALDKTISGSALNFTANDLNSTDHDCNLIPRNDIILSLDCAIMGLGNSSCGPGVLKKYAIEKKEHVLHIRLNRVK